MCRSIQVRAKRHALVGDLAQIVEAENLKAARVGEYRPIPRHEPVQSAHLPNRLDPRPQIKMVSIGQKNLHTQLFQYILRNALDRAERSDRHKHRRLNLSMRSDELARAGRAASCFNLQAE